jgi:hypothetical protein
MADAIALKKKEESSQILTKEEAGESSPACPVRTAGWLKRILPMAVCCGAPLLLLLAIPFVGSIFGSLAAVTSGLLSVVAVLACPVGMYLMMRMMMKK